MPFDFAAFPTLITERLSLRQLTRADAPAIQALYSSAEVMRFLSEPRLDTLGDAVGMIDWFDGMYRSHNAVQWAITLRGDDHLIGACGTYAWDRENRHVDIGYTIAPDRWGRGYATEAARAIIRWCFDHLDVHRIQADCTEGNIASERVMLNCGFTFEGLWRESCWEHGRFVNIKQFGLLRAEYESG